MWLIHNYLFLALWLSYVAYWWAMSANLKPTELSEPTQSRLRRLALMLCAIALLALPSVPIRLLNQRFLPHEVWCFWLGATLTAAGLLFSIWARHHLGKNWSQAVTVKHDHEFIVTGPYSIVRHPIYSGLLLDFIGSALARAEFLFAVVLVFVALWRKLKLEEKWMHAQFGDSYEAYSGWGVGASYNMSQKSGTKLAGNPTSAASRGRTGRRSRHRASEWPAPSRYGLFCSRLIVLTTAKKEGKSYCTRSPTRLAHPLEDQPAVVIHVIGPSFQGQRQN